MTFRSSPSPRTTRAKRVRAVGGESTRACRCVPMSVRGAAWSWTETTTRRATSWRERSSSERGVVPWGTREPKRLGTAGLLLPTARWSVAPAGGTKNLPHSCGQSVKDMADAAWREGGGRTHHGDRRGRREEG